MQRTGRLLTEHSRAIGGLVLAAVLLVWLLLYKLGSLTGGLSAAEAATAIRPVGWHGVYHQPFYLPLEVVRSVVFALWPHHGRTLTRLPDAVFGGLAIISFAWLIRLWHGTRTAVLAGVLFAAAAWTLHVSRLASYDVLYLWATPALLLTNVLLYKYVRRPFVWYGSLLLWGMLLYVPGLVWLIGLSAWLQRGPLKEGWTHFARWWQRALYVLAGLVWLPLLIVELTRPRAWLTWLGWPHHLAGPGTLLKQFAGVPVHLFVRGPEYPQLWLGRAPLLDVFSLAVCLIGIYFYVRHWRAARSRLLGGFALIGFVLVGLGGPVGLSVLVPLLYAAAATGIAFLLHAWLARFPNNPLARGVGIFIIAVAVGLSCLYNVRAYFVAWPHNPTTQVTFNYRR